MLILKVIPQYAISIGDSNTQCTFYFTRNEDNTSVHNIRGFIHLSQNDEDLIKELFFDSAIAEKQNRDSGHSQSKFFVFNTMSFSIRLFILI